MEQHEAELFAKILDSLLKMVEKQNLLMSNMFGTLVPRHATTEIEAE
jgi:hypothetical protein